MKSKEIQKLFIEYMLGERKKVKYANENETPAIIYGSDEFKIDRKKSRIKIDILGWIEIEDISLDCDLKDIEWIAIKSTEGVYSLIVSSNINIFSETAENPLYIDGQVFAVPSSIKPKFFIN